MLKNYQIHYRKQTKFNQ